MAGFYGLRLVFETIHCVLYDEFIIQTKEFYDFFLVTQGLMTCKFFFFFRIHLSARWGTEPYVALLASLLCACLPKKKKKLAREESERERRREDKYLCVELGRKLECFEEL